MGWNHRGRRWTKEEIELLKGDMLTSEIARLTDRKMSVVNAARCRFKKKKAFIKGYRGPNQAGNSIRDHSYPGPDGWTVDNGPPCLLCIFHNDKLTDFYTRLFRDECRCCTARLAWDAHNGGRPQRSDYFEYVPDQYQTDEIGVE